MDSHDRVGSLRASTIHTRFLQGFYTETEEDEQVDEGVSEIEYRTEEVHDSRFADRRQQATYVTSHKLVVVIDSEGHDANHDIFIECKKCCICLDTLEIGEIAGDYDCLCVDASVCKTCFNTHLKVSEKEQFRCPLCRRIVSCNPIIYIE